MGNVDPMLLQTLPEEPPTPFPHSRTHSLTHPRSLSLTHLLEQLADEECVAEHLPRLHDADDGRVNLQLSWQQIRSKEDV